MPDERIFAYIDRDQMEKLLEGFAKTANVGARLSDPNGETLCGPFNYTDLCLRYNYEDGRSLCEASARRQCQKLSSKDRYIIYRCAGDGDKPGETGAGLVDALVPIHVAGEHLANIVCGQLLYEKPDDATLKQFEKFASEKLGLNEEAVGAYVTTARQVRVREEGAFEQIVQFLLWLANLISTYAYDHYQVAQLRGLMEVKAPSPDDLVCEVLKTIARMIPQALGINLWYFDGDEFLVLKACWKLDPEKITRHIISFAHSVCGRAIRQGEVVRLDPRKSVEFADSHLVDVCNIQRVIAVPYPDLAGGRRHLGGIVVLLGADVPEPSESVLALVSQVRGMLEAAVQRDSEKHRRGIIAAAADLVTAEPEDFWSVFDRITEETLPDLKAYVLYRLDEYGASFKPTRTHIFRGAPSLDHSALRKFCRHVFERVRERNAVIVRHDVMSEHGSRAMKALFSQALPRDAHGSDEFSVVAAPLFDNEHQLMGGLVCVAARAGRALPEHEDCTVFASFTQRHIDALRGIASVLSMVLVGHSAEERRAIAQTMRSHELVAPIHAIKGYHDNLTFVFDTDVKPFIQDEANTRSVFERDLSRLGNMCDLLGMVATSGSLEGRVLFNRVPFEREILLELIPPLRSYARGEKHVSIHYADEFRQLPFLHLSVERMKRCVFNLLFNAVKYSKRSSRIDVTVRDSEANWEIQVINDGIGVPAGEEERIFRRFVQGSNADAEAAYGAGLGLYIARAIARAHGGDVGVIDPRPKTTTFGLVLPKSLSSSPPPQLD